MPIHPSSNLLNLKASIQKYLIDNLQGSNGFPTDIESDAWDFDGPDDYEAKSYRVRPTVRFGASQPLSGFQAVRPILLYLEAYLKRVAFSTDLHAPEKALNLFRGVLHSTARITVLDHAGDDSELGALWVRKVDPIQYPKDPHWFRSGLIAELGWIETDTI